MTPTSPPASAWRLGRRAELTTGRLAWDRFGEGPAVVLVHGTPSWSLLWRNVVPVLAEHLRVHVVDLLGYGDSERSLHQDMSITAQGRALAELLGYLELERPVLVGHDIGGATVLRSHLIEGRGAGAIVLVDAVALNPWNTPTTVHIRRHVDAYRTMPSHIYEEVVKAHLRTAVSVPLDDETLAAYLAPWKGEDGQAAYFRKIAQWTADDVGALETALPAIDVPTLLIWGEEDHWLDLSVARSLQDRIPGSRLRVIPRAGHFSPEDAPAQVAAEILAFAAGASAS
ncbi:MAG TPA: alpha/beta hydrolase [Acidimicrobiales bacterium]|nr:alpha/beta hydrolase [Acidimicrobiales bacterium]